MQHALRQRNVGPAWKMIIIAGCRATVEMRRSSPKKKRSQLKNRRARQWSDECKQAGHEDMHSSRPLMMGSGRDQEAGKRPGGGLLWALIKLRSLCHRLISLGLMNQNVLIVIVQGHQAGLPSAITIDALLSLRSLAVGLAVGVFVVVEAGLVVLGPAVLPLRFWLLSCWGPSLLLLAG